ncbi:non-ribosomal peptide synthetase [Micromonospora halophytica]|uniref:Amino acid adenylation domain-containing protein n=1 Tax=Micromonospora halophytica TaxID=47864 RepID=A0A1C5JFJ3_9ACTN|nr:non-ribosomal peptide synthetase [Micromonospora halophytica]SCG69330.1 amino acid adenylation domain-containing protein [Micromonospora halophytica]
MTDLTRRLAALPAPRRAQFLARLREFAEAVAGRGPTPRGDTGPTPLSYAQQNLWFFDHPVPNGPASGTPLCLRLRGALDLDALRSALAAVVARHDTLRSQIVEREGGLMQVVATEVPVSLPVVEAEGDDHGQPLAAARALVVERAGEPFDLSRMPAWRAVLVRVAVDDHLFLFDVPTVLCDAPSRILLLRELAVFYRASESGDAAQPPGLPVQYGDYAIWQRGRLDSGELDQRAAYWRDKLAGVEVVEFPTDRPRAEVRTFAVAGGSFTVGHEAMERAGELARAVDASLSDVLVAAFFALLHRYCGVDDLVIGSPDAHLRPAAVASLIGLFTDLRVLRADVSGDPAFRELVQRVARVSAEAHEQGGLPLRTLTDVADPVVDPSRAPLFQIVFGVESTESTESTPGLPGIATSQEAVPAGTSPFDMRWTLTEQSAAGVDASLAITYNTGLFDAGSVARFARHYDALLHALTAAPDAPLSAAGMLSPAEREFLAQAAMGPVRPVRESTIVEEFEARVQEAPESVAVVVAGRETSYAELNARANRLAALLRERSVGPGARVGLCLRRSLDVVTAILAVLKAGAAYVPLDTTHPSGRVAEIAADAEVRVVLAHAEAGRAVSEVAVPVVVLDDVRGELAALPEGNPPLAAQPGDVAYVIYTSGSTGKPKGVLLEHRGVVNFTDSTRDLFDLTSADRVLGFASVTFDVSVFEIFSALLTGARLCLATDDERLSVDRLQSLMVQAGITVIDLPPTVLPLLAPEKFTALRIAFVGGEAFSGELVNRWNPGRRLFNGYGPTECTVTMIVEECQGTWDASPPIGLPMANHIAHVLDGDLRQVPVGVPGELVIGGAGLARGYLNREELNAEKFLADPFGTAPGGRLYRTGDLVKRLPDGRLVFLGRIDQQVKIRGLRIELGDVESALTGFEGIGPVSVQAWSDDSGDRHLVGYLTGVTAEHVPAVREHVRALLPSYMIPSFFVVLDELPLTSSGKVDRRRLPPPDLSRAGTATGTGGTPLTETERRLLRDVLVPLLHNERIGVHDDFFLAGGNSLKAVQLMSTIRRRFGVEIAPGEFFASPSAAHLAAAVDAAQAARSMRRVDDGDPLDAPADPPGPEAVRAPVVIRAAGPAQVVLLHPSGGELFCYVPLSRALGGEIGVTGFAADPRDADAAPAEAMAATAARIARSLVEGGLLASCCLAGWSYGGVLAFEVARQIEQKTGERPSVVLLDAAYDEDAEPLDEATVRRRFVHDVARLNGHDGPEVTAVLNDPDAGTADIRETLTGLGVELELTGQELARRFATFRSSALSQQEYRPPTPYGGPVTLVTAGPNPAMEEQWRAVCTGPFRAESVPGDHYTLFTAPALSRVVAAIEETLRA